MTTTATLPAISTLQPGKQWVCFDKGKQPYNPLTGYGAKADDPTTWGTYEQAMKATNAQKDRYIGVGREFIKGQGITGVDLDHCIDEQGNLTGWARYVVNLLDSYTEYSPSGRGLHIWVYGALPNNLNPAIKEDGDMATEAYDSKRYFTITSKHFEGTPVTIEHRQEQLTELYEQVQERRQKAKQAKQKTPKLHKQNAPAADDTPYGLKALDAEYAELAATGEGGRNHQLNVSAYKLGQLVGGHELTRSTVEDRLYSAARQCGLHDSEIEKTLRSGIEDGILSPRSAPAPAPQVMSNGYGSDGTIPIAPAATGDNLPPVILSGQLRDKWNVALNALRKAEEKNRHIFVQSARLVQIGQDDKKHPIIMQLGIAELKNALSRSADYFRLKETKDGLEQIEISPPKEIAEAILALDPSEWKLPSLEAIVETPVMRPDGSILDTPGYDEATRLYYFPQEGMKFCKVPSNPTRRDIAAALAVIDDAIGEFPYADLADRANAYGCLLTPFIRPSVRHVPLALIDAPKQGTGKGLYSDVVSTVATGSSSAILTLSDSDEELQKSITALLIEGVTIITIDNIAGKLQSKHLDGALTSDIWRGRILGLSKFAKVPQRATWIATGNNIRLGGDLARRCYRIRLDPHVSKPWMRQDFKHEDLLTWVTEQRAELITALLTLARAWYLAGKPQPKNIPSLGTFTGWSKTIGGILAHCGIEGFLTNLDKLYDEADEDSAQWEGFLNAWRDLNGQEWKTTSEVFKTLTEAATADSATESADSVFLSALPDTLQVSFKEKPASFSIILGKALEKRVEACFGDKNLRIEREKDSHTKSKKWRVIGDFADSADSPLTHVQQKKLDNKTQKNDIENGEEYYPHYPHSDMDASSDDSAISPVEPSEENSLSSTGGNTLSAKSALSAKQNGTMPKPPMCAKCGNTNPSWQPVYKSGEIVAWRCVDCS